MPSIKRQIIFILFLQVFAIYSYSQNNNTVDSLKQALSKSDNKAETYIQLAEEYITISADELIHYSKLAYQEAHILKDEALIGESLFLQARGYNTRYDYKKCNFLADSALHYFHKLDNLAKIANCHALKASTHMLQGEFEEALELFGKSATESKEAGADNVYASVLLNMGRIYRVRGEHNEALANFQEVLKIAEKLKDDYLIGHAYHFIGLVYQDKQFFDLAIENYLEALSLFEKNQVLQHIPFILVDLGSSCREGKNYIESIKYYNQALEYFIKTQDTWGLYEMNRNKGLSYMEMDELDSAWSCFENSLSYSRKINEKPGECLNLNYLGEVLIFKEDYKQALKYLEQALAIEKTIDNKLTATNILFNLGKCNVYMGKSQKGLDILKQSLFLADSLEVIYEQMVINKELSTAYTLLKQYKNALNHYEIYAELKDSIYKEESNRSFAEMERRFQSEKQKQEISKLNLDNVEQEITIKKQRSARNIFILGFLFASIIGILFYRSFKIRKKADQEKEALLKEIHHRVKNNLQIISSLLSIQSDNVSDTKVLNTVQESQSRVKAMALIHQLLYQDQDLSHINFSTYLPQLVNALSSIFKKEGIKVTPEIDAADIAFDIDTAVPLGLIVAELTSNAFKYAFDGKTEGLIKIEVKNIQGNEYLLTVADNGPGLPKDTKIKELDSLGLRLVNILTDQLDGKFNYKYNNGAVFTVKLSIPT